MNRIVVRKSWDTTASPEAVFALVKDSSTYPDWTPVQAYQMERPGRDELHGVGEIRVLITGPLRPVEEIVEVIPNRYVAYILLSGLPMRDYRGETWIEPRPSGGARITWQSSFYEQYPFTGWFWRLVMSWVLNVFVRSAAKAAEAASSVDDGRSGSASDKNIHKIKA